MPLEAYKAFMPAFDEEFDDLAEAGTRPVSHIVDGAANLTPRVELLPALLESQAEEGPPKFQ